ncbi:MAG: PSD1 and planctomycete cytochrome C domain-containing protein [Pirellulales bacterium]
MHASTLALVAAILAIASLHARALEPADSRELARQARQVLSSRCFQCHGPDDAAREAELRLDDRQAALAELPSGSRAVVPGDLDASALLERVTSQDPQHRMPPPKVGAALTATEVGVLREWIGQGAQYATHWAYVAPVRPALPAVTDPAWTVNGVDQFILARLDREGLKPAPPADRATILRRVALDLTGLPPTVNEMRRFGADDSPGAYERAVDAQLAKPSFGERWAALWLDLARYGDSQGYIHDPPRTIWRWRDWLIRALNDNMPYDRLSIEMLAGDLLANATASRRIATGFHRNTTNNTEGGANSEEYRHASVVDRVNTTMQVWMGTTIGCAQCHNHKYDPFTQKEYFQLFAIFNNTEDANSEPPILETARIGQEEAFVAVRALLDETRRLLDEESARTDPGLASWEASVDRAALPKEIVEVLDVAADKRSQDQTAKLLAHYRGLSPAWSARNAEVARLQAELERVSTTTLVMKEGPLRPTHVAVRGNYRNLGDVVEPGLPAALDPPTAGARLDRLALAEWLVDRRNPLTARVAVNRLWQEIFGVGIVETAEDFGNQGEPPVHPELLDWLATEYQGLDWDTKALLKLMVMSATYCQSSHTNAELAARDPYNRLLARGPRVRLSAEAVRDQALQVSGLLSAKLYGPPVHPPQPLNGLAAAFGASTDWETSHGDDRYRRALYTLWRRNLPYASMLAFDAPERSVCSVRRIRSNTPLQALVTLNDPVFVEAAQALARRILSEGGTSAESRAEFAFCQVLLRAPQPVETQRMVMLLEQARHALAEDAGNALTLATKPLGPLPSDVDAVEAAAWTVVGNVLLNLDETLSKP